MAEEEQKEQKEPKFKQTWKCPRCGTKMTTHVRLSESPTCGNKTHSTKIVTMEEV